MRIETLNPSRLLPVGWLLIFIISASLPAAQAGDVLNDVGYLVDKPAFVLTARVANLLNWAPIRQLRDLNIISEEEFGFGLITWKDLENIDRITIAADKETLYYLTISNGLAVPQPLPTDSNRNLDRLGRAFIDYQDANSRFPRANGDGNGQYSGLSWRVHLLPYLGEEGLYKQFHLDEAWDSEHNKSLIPKMPEVFVADGVEAAGKTSLHVLVDPKGLFPKDAKTGRTLQELAGGFSATLVVIEASPETATEWTKPGGLEVDAAKPLACLGERVPGGERVVMLDSSVKSLSPDISAETFLKCLRTDDISVYTIEGAYQGYRRSMKGKMPGIAFTFRQPFDVNRFGAFERGTQAAGGEIVHDFNGIGLWSRRAKSTTLIITDTESLVKRIKQGKTANVEDARLIDQLDIKADMSSVMSLSDQQELLASLRKHYPSLKPLETISTATASIRLTELVKGDAVVKATAYLAKPAPSASLIEDLRTCLAAFQAAASTVIDNKIAPTDRKLLNEILKSAEIDQRPDKITLSVTAPEGVENLPRGLQALTQTVGEHLLRIQENRRDRANLEIVSSLIYSHAEFLRSFPAVAIDFGRSKHKFSWRVALLRLMGPEETAIFREFNFDEPWDSEHNLKISEKMPAFYRTHGVSDPNKTCIHIPTGKGMPFDKETMLYPWDFSGNPGETLIVLIAGPDKAEVWTKPGGLEIDVEDPIKSLGKIDSKFFALFADGSLRPIPSTITRVDFLKMLQREIKRK